MPEKTDFLKIILKHKRLEVDAAKAKVSEKILIEQVKKTRQHRPFFEKLAKPGALGANIISEIKRASPSKGIIKKGLDPAIQAQAYEKGGAAAISVLTDEKFFKGSPDDLKIARKNSSLPVLRKDFIVSKYQIYEAAIMNADAVLLIASALSVDFMKQALELCKELTLDALVEIHCEQELEKASRAGACLIGINNRDLTTFKTDLSTTTRISKALLPGQVAVAESGIKNRADIEKLLDAGVWNFLIGESLVRALDPEFMLRQLLGESP